MATQSTVSHYSTGDTVDKSRYTRLAIVQEYMFMFVIHLHNRADTSANVLLI